MTLSEASMVQSWLLLKPMILYGTMLFMVTVVMCCTDFAASPVPGNGILSSMRLPSLPRNSFSSSLWYSCMILPCSLTQVRLAWLHCHHCETTHTLWKKDYLAWWCVHVYLLWLCLSIMVTRAAFPRCRSKAFSVVWTCVPPNLLQAIENMYQLQRYKGQGGDPIWQQCGFWHLGWDTARGHPIPFLFVIVLGYVLRKATSGREHYLGLTKTPRRSRRHPTVVLTNLD